MSRSLDDLRSEVRPMVDAFLQACKDAGFDVLVTCTSRTLAEQAALYAQGRTAPGRIVTDAPAGKSAHNYGLAFDVVPMVNGKPDWNGEDPVWQRMGAIGQKVGLEWAGGSAQTWTVRISSSTASDSVDVGGHAGTRRYGGIETAAFSLEEYYPSSG